MSGAGEAGLVLGIISSIISIVTATKHIYHVANNASGLPKSFQRVAAKLPAVLLILQQANEHVKSPGIDENSRDTLQQVLVRCQSSAQELLEIFQKALPKNGASRTERYFSAAKGLGQGSRVEELTADILQEIGLLLASSSFATQQAVQAIGRAMEDVPIIESPLGSEKTNSQPRVLTLQQIQYQDDQAQTKTLDAITVLRGWLLPNSIPEMDNAADHAAYSQKRFHDSDTGYSSCQWIFETPDYQKFVQREVSKVWRLRGSPGCGKSVLIASIISKLEQSMPMGTRHDAPKIFYHYSRCDVEQLTSLTLVRVLLAQVLDHATTAMVKEFRTIYSAHSALKTCDVNKMEEDLWRLLRTVLGLLEQKTFIIVDGIDNYVQPLVCARSLVKVIANLDAKAQCSLLVTSRLGRRDAFDSTSIRSSMVKSAIECLQLEITADMLRQDLQRFVTFEVSSYSWFLAASQIERSKIVSSICNRADGMFLYASLALQDLRQETISSIADIEISLAKLPDGLFESYEKKLELPLNSRRGSEALLWILYAKPALSWNEFKSAFAIGEGFYDDRKIILDSCDEFIKHTCGQLVETFGEGEQLRFIHSTVADFLTSRGCFGDTLDIRSAPSMIAGKLLTFLQYLDLPAFASPIMQSPQTTIRTYTAKTGQGLYTFANLNWYKYLKLCKKDQDQHLEVQLRQFLRSKFFVRWLKTTIIMSNISHGGYDSVSLTIDVVDSLQSWVSGRTWFLEDSEFMIQSWIEYFLDMMLDWGKVIKIQPDWIHYLHQQLLPIHSSFRDILEDNDGDQSIVQFKPSSIRTKSSEPTTWPERCFAMDLDKDLAFTYDEPFISCYHIKTGLLTAEIRVTVPSKVHGPLAVRRGVLCPQGKYLAVLFEALGPSNDPVGKHIRAGRRLQLNMASSGFKWEMDDANMSFDISGILAHMAIGVDAAEFVVCLLEISHTGTARTHMFRLPSWAGSSVLVTGSQSMRWDLDDVDILQFSEDSTKLVTTFGTFDLGTGRRYMQWPFALGHFYQGGRVTKDLGTFITILRDIEGACIVQLFDITPNLLTIQETPSREIRFSGVLHLLANSNHGRFLLLTKRETVQTVKRARSRNTNPPAQQASIGIWDCEEREWTPLLVLDPKFLNKLSNWNFLPYLHTPRFSPERSVDGDVNRVFLCVPSHWRLSGNIRASKSLDPTESHLLLFEANTATNGFGKNPTLKLQLFTKAFGHLGSGNTGIPRLLSWSQTFDVATIYEGGSVIGLNHDSLRLANTVISNKANVLPEILAEAELAQCFSTLIIAADGSAIFHIQVLVHSTHSDMSHLAIDRKAEGRGMTDGTNYVYEISVGCLRAGTQQAENYTLSYTAPLTTYQPSIGLQFACCPDETSISFGAIELDISHDESLSITNLDSGKNLLDRVIECFKLRSHPLKHDDTEMRVFLSVEDSASTRYIIFTELEMNLADMRSASKDLEDILYVVGETSSQDDQHVFQFSRVLRHGSNEFENKEARQFEVCLLVYDENIDDITWMLHTTTGGDISKSREHIPATLWALHQELPLLAWQSPGHRLRISNIEGCGIPVTVAESLNIDADTAHAMSFSRDGRYLLVQAQESFRNDMLSLRQSDNLCGVVICDLHKGLTFGATMISESSVSVELGHEVLNTYRLTRDGAVESTTYTLPELIVKKRQYLTFIPDNCCCVTCGKDFSSQCKISIIEYEGSTLASLGHSIMGIGKASMRSEVCQPLMIRITTPPVEQNTRTIQEAVFMVNSIRLFPAIINDRGAIIDTAFNLSQDLQHKCTRLQESNCVCARCVVEAATQDKSVDVTWIPQMELKIADYKLPSGVHVPPEQTRYLHHLSEQAGGKDTRMWDISEYSSRDSIDSMKSALGEDIFPWDSWTEFKEAMDEIKDVFDLKEYMNRMFEPGNCGAGCQTPLFVHTFCFPKDQKKNDLQWSSAMGTGWLEEDLVWYYERFFQGSFEGARRWYEFPAYGPLAIKMEKLKREDTATGKRFRRYFFPKIDTQGKVSNIEAPEKKTVAAIEMDGMVFDQEIRPLATGLIMKDVWESMSDLVPGLGKIFEQRMHSMLDQSLIKVLIE